MSGLENALLLLGRFAIGGFFLWKAIEKIRNWGAVSQALKKRKVSYVSWVLPISTAIQLVGGLLIILGFYAHIGAVLLSFHMVIHMYRLHSFWQLSKGAAERAVEQLMFMKDLAILGGLLIVFAVGSGQFSVM